ncbi:60S ribosomal protein L36-2 [Linum perenne]
MASQQPEAGLFVGLNRGHIVTNTELPPRPSDSIGETKRERVRHVKSLIDEVAGIAPYKKKTIQLLRTGPDYTAMSLGRKKLGTHGRARKNSEDMTALILKMRAAGERV